MELKPLYIGNNCTYLIFFEIKVTVPLFRDQSGQTIVSKKLISISICKLYLLPEALPDINFFDNGLNRLIAKKSEVVITLPMKVVWSDDKVIYVAYAKIKM